MKNEILVDGKHTIPEFRKILDRQSGIPGLPGMIVHEPEPETIEALGRARVIDVVAGLEYGVQNAIDGMIELVPRVVPGIHT